MYTSVCGKEQTMAKMEQRVKFYRTDGSVAFVIADGGSVYIGGKECIVTYINEEFFLIDLKCYSHDEFMRDIVLDGQSVVAGRGVVCEAMAARA